MTNENDPSPLTRLRQVVVPELAPAEERARRQHVVERIQALQRAGFPREAPRPEPKASSWASLTSRVSSAVSRALSGMPRPLLGLALAGGVALGLWFAVGLFGGEPIATGHVLVQSGHVLVQSPDHRVLAESGQALELSFETTLSATDDAALQLPSHADVVLQGGTQLRIAQAEPKLATRERIALERGRVALSVPKLSNAQSLSVRTHDAMVEVHGTRFSVEVMDGPRGEALTRVEVTEGVVSVTCNGQRELLYAGQSWSSEVRSAVSTQSANVPVANTAATPSNAASSDADRAAPAASSVSSEPTEPSEPNELSELSEQNRLFQSALEARKRGATSLAIERLATLMARHPRSELAHNARVEHFRLLAASGKQNEARQSALAYLRDYPKGFARAEAQRVVEH